MGMEWTVPVEWQGETVFIVAGGPSVATQPVSKLTGRKVIVINSSYELLPDADFLYTMDNRWLKYHQSFIKSVFKGKVVTNSQDARRLDWPELLLLRKIPPPGLATDPRYTTGLRTSLHGAINLACHLIGWKGKIVLLGADGGRDATGKTHHHTAHPWSMRKNCWDEQLVDLQTTVSITKKAGIEVLNASPGTHWPIWPITDLERVLALERPVPAVVVCPDIQVSVDFITNECGKRFMLEQFVVVTSEKDLIHLVPFLGRGVRWCSIGHNKPEVIEKVRSMFGTDKSRDDFVQWMRGN